MWPRFGDVVVIYSLLTPLCVMYWHATYQLLDMYLHNNLTNMLVVGYAVVVLLTLMHETFRCVADKFEYKCIFEFIYDYIMFTACLSYVHGCKLFYNMMRQSAPPLAIAAGIGVFLIVVRGFRNILALPAVVNNDRMVDRYRPRHTLIFFNGEPGMHEVFFMYE